MKSFAFGITSYVKANIKEFAFFVGKKAGERIVDLVIVGLSFDYFKKKILKIEEGPLASLMVTQKTTYRRIGVLSMEVNELKKARSLDVVVVKDPTPLKK